MGIHSNFTSAFRALNSKIEQAKKATMKEIANTGTRFWIDGFNKEGFTDYSFQQWKPRVVTGKIKKKDITRKLLVKSGRLKRAVNKSVFALSSKQVIWRIDDNEVPYAKFINEGTIKMQKREIMGNSHVLNKKFKGVIEKVMRAYVK